MDMVDLKKRALEILALYSEQAKDSNAEPWTRQELVLGFIGDVGSLVKYTMAADNLRQIPDHNKNLEHELADCLWSLLIIAEKYDIDLEQAFTKTMNELEAEFVVDGDG